MTQSANAALHDAYASDYDHQVQIYDCHLASALFGLAYEFLLPGQTLLDLGIGSGLSAEPFAKAGLHIYGLDFSKNMLEICQNKAFTTELKQHDIQQTPLPYPSGSFDHLVCCGVFHFISNLEMIFGEAKRVLREGGLFGFTTRVGNQIKIHAKKYKQESIGGFEIYSHSPGYLGTLLDQYAFERIKKLNCFVGGDIFTIWIVQKNNSKIDNTPSPVQF
jgi:predicted TPR repeat methyltransferase